MNTEANNQEGAVQPEVTTPAAVEKFEVSKTEYDELIKTRESYGSLKREFKDLKKSLEERPQEPAAKAPDALSQKAYLAARGITAADEIDLALATAKKWGMDVDAVVDDEDFVAKLDKVRTTKANAAATSNVAGGNSEASAKSTPEYWIAKGTPPTPDQVPNRQTRASIIRAMMKNGASTGKFHNE